MSDLLFSAICWAAGLYTGWELYSLIQERRERKGEERDQ